MNKTSYHERGIQFLLKEQDGQRSEQQPNIYEFLYNYLNDYDIDCLYQKENQIICEYCDGIGSIHFSFEIKGITGWVDTCLLGPGFHHAAILLLEDIEKECCLKLEVKDNSYYYEKRDFRKLQEDYATFFSESINTLAEQSEQTLLDQHKMLPYVQGKNVIPVCKGMILSPMGPIEPMVIFPQNSLQTKMLFAEQYFLWFEKKKNQTYIEKYKNYERWNINIAEEEKISEKLEKAITGYRNGFLHHLLPNGWWITMHGSFEPEYQGERYTTDSMEEQLALPVYFIREGIQIRILYAYAIEGEEWFRLHSQTEIAEILNTDKEEKLFPFKYQEVHPLNGRRFVSQNCWGDDCRISEWSGEVFIEGQVLVLDAESEACNLTDIIQPILLSIKRANLKL